MAPVLTTALTRLRTDFNTIAPNRDKASDGWIGDQAHKDRISGHNPDETGGGEYEDADNKDEVRAIDVDTDLRVPGLTMLKCVNKILATPNDLRRIRYIIYNRVIWSKSDGWRPRAYTGSNPHDKHCHFSGDPTADESAEGWSILSLVEEDVSAEDVWNYRINSPGLGKNAVAAEWLKGVWATEKKVDALAAAVAAIAEKVDIDATELEAIKQAAREGAASSTQDIIDGVLGGLPDGVNLTKDDVRQALRDFYAPAVANP